MTWPVASSSPGFKEALQLMKVGDKWRVIIPPELGYGETGTPGGPIPPNATLVFEIELLERHRVTDRARAARRLDPRTRRHAAARLGRGGRVVGPSPLEPPLQRIGF